MKKIVSSLAALAVLLMPFGAISASAADSQVEIGTVTAEAGAADVEVPINITANAGIAALAVSFEYDANVLKLEKVDNKQLFGTDMSFTPSGKMDMQPFNILLEDGLATENYTNVGTIAILHFSVAAGAPAGEYPIALSYDENSTFDWNMDNVTFTTVSGAIVIGGGETTTAPAETTTVAETTAAPVVETTAAETTAAPVVETTAAETTAAPVVETTVAETTAAPVVETTVAETTAAPEKTAAKYSNAELADMAKKDYESKHAGASVKASAETKEDGTVVITLTGADGKVVSTYTVDANTGKGQDENNKAVDLPQTGVTGYGAFAAVAGAVAMLGAGAWLTVGVARKKDEE